MSLSVTPIYAAVLVCLYIYLSYRVIIHRRTYLKSIGDEGDLRLLQLMRAHGNFAEYAPFGLLLLLMIELMGAPALALHLMGLLLLAGRFIHARAFLSEKIPTNQRVLGMALTFAMLILSALGLFLHVIF